MLLSYCKRIKLCTWNISLTSCQCMKDAGIYLMLKLFKDEVVYLGHQIIPETLSVYEDSKARQTESHVLFPQTIKQKRIFLPMAKSYNRFVQDFAKISSPLTVKLKKQATWIRIKNCPRSWPPKCLHRNQKFPHLSPGFGPAQDREATQILLPSETERDWNRSPQQQS